MYMIMSSGDICINVQMPLLFNCEMGKVSIPKSSDEYEDVYKKGVLRVL